MRGLSWKVLGVGLLALCLVATSAQAAEVPNHPFLTERFPNKSPLKGTATPAGSFEDACGVAVDSQGDIYIADYYHHAVDVFDSGGSYLRQIAGVDPAGGPCGIAVDSAGNVYVNDYHRDVIRYEPTPFPPITYDAGTVIDADHPTGLAIDPASDDLYLNARTHVSVYDSAGALVQTLGQGTIGDGFGVAVSRFGATDGYVYVADASDDTVKVYDPTVSLTNPVEVIDGAGTPQGRFVSLFDSSLAVDQSNGHLFVSDNLQPGFEHPAAAVYEFGATGLYRGQLNHALVHAEPVGVTVDESSGHKGEVYVTSGNGSADPFPQVPNSEESVLYGFGPAGAAQTLDVTKSGVGEGTVTSKAAGINCGGSCAAEFNSGATLTLTATPAPGSAFGGWSGACSGTGTCQLTMSAAQSVGAEFIAAPALAEASSAGLRSAPSFAPSAAAPSAASAPTTAKGKHHRKGLKAKHRKHKRKGVRR